ncbi:MAG: redoxin domain-containing protein [Bacteroidota bacterium]|nr:redoxin domain-containing protein [Bacteroidota bacterium]
MKQITTRTEHAPEIYADFWFNSRPLSIQSLQGSVVLLLFWNFTSEASLRAVRIAEAFHGQYAEMGLTVIGIHTPEFHFAKDPRRVEETIRRLDLHFAIATDNTRTMWDAYRVREIPTMILIDRENILYAIHTGETGYEHLERSVQALLRDAGYRGILPPLFSIVQKPVDYPSVPIPAMQTGYLHGALGNVEGYSPELPAHYTDPGVHVERKFYAQGLWRAGKNSFEYCGESAEGGDGYLTFTFSGSDVNAVIGADQPAAVRLEMDRASVPPASLGHDVVIDGNGKSFVQVSEAKLVYLIRSNDAAKHILKISPGVRGTIIYSISFDTPSGLQEHEQREEKFRNN